MQAQGRGDLLAQRLLVDRGGLRELLDFSQQGGLHDHRPDRCVGHAEQGRPQRMGMCYRTYVGASPIDLRMDMKFHRRHGLAFEQLSVQVDDHEVIYGKRAAHGLAGVDEHPLGAWNTCAEMTVEVDDLGSLQHAHRLCQHLLALAGVPFVCCHCRLPPKGFAQALPMRFRARGHRIEAARLGSNACLRPHLVARAHGDARRANGRAHRHGRADAMRRGDEPAPCRGRVPVHPRSDFGAA